MLNTIFRALFRAKACGSDVSVFDAMEQFEETPSGGWQTIRSMNTAFCIRLAGSGHPAYKAAGKLLEQSLHAEN